MSTRVISKVGVNGRPVVCKREVEYLQVLCISASSGTKWSLVLENESSLDADLWAALRAKAICMFHFTHNTTRSLLIYLSSQNVDVLCITDVTGFFTHHSLTF